VLHQAVHKRNLKTRSSSVVEKSRTSPYPTCKPKWATVNWSCYKHIHCGCTLPAIYIRPASMPPSGQAIFKCV